MQHLCIRTWVYISLWITYVLCKTLVPKYENLVDQAIFEFEVTKGRWLAIYCIDDDNRLLDGSAKIDCAHKSGSEWRRIATTFNGEPFILRSWEIWQPEPEGNCVNKQNVAFIIPHQQSCQGKAVLKKVNTKEVHRFFSSNVRRFMYLHICYDDTQSLSTGYCEDSTTIFYIRDTREGPVGDISLQHVPWNQAGNDLWSNMHLLLGPDDTQFIPAPYPRYMWVGEECPAAKVVVPPPVPGINIPGNMFPPGTNSPIIEHNVYQSGSIVNQQSFGSFAVPLTPAGQQIPATTPTGTSQTSASPFGTNVATSVTSPQPPGLPQGQANLFNQGFSTVNFGNVPPGTQTSSPSMSTAAPSGILNPPTTESSSSATGLPQGQANLFNQGGSTVHVRNLPARTSVTSQTTPTSTSSAGTGSPDQPSSDLPSVQEDFFNQGQGNVDVNNLPSAGRK